MHDCGAVSHDILDSSARVFVTEGLEVQIGPTVLTTSWVRRCAGPATLYFDRGCTFFHAVATQTVNGASRIAKTLKLHLGTVFEHEGAEV